jgi:hypothetical protein
MFASFWDVVGCLLFALFLGSFSVWLTAYFAYQVALYAAHGPSPQLRSVGTSILDEPPLEAHQGNLPEILPPSAA